MYLIRLYFINEGSGAAYCLKLSPGQESVVFDTSILKGDLSLIEII